MTVESNLLLKSCDHDPRVLASLSDNELAQRQKEVEEEARTQSRLAQLHFGKKLDPMYDPRVDAANKSYGDTTSGRA